MRDVSAAQRPFYGRLWTSWLVGQTPDLDVEVLHEEHSDLPVHGWSEIIFHIGSTSVTRGLADMPGWSSWASTNVCLTREATGEGA